MQVRSCVNSRFIVSNANVLTYITFAGHGTTGQDSRRVGLPTFVWLPPTKQTDVPVELIWMKDPREALKGYK